MKREILIGAAVAVIVFLSIGIVSHEANRPKWVRLCPQPDITAYELARTMSENRRALLSEPSMARHLCEDK